MTQPSVAHPKRREGGSARRAAPRSSPRRRPTRIVRLRWADGAPLRGSRDGVKAAEIEEVLRWGPYLRTDGLDRYFAYGATAHGRMLVVVLQRIGPRALHVVAARDQTDRERDACRERTR